MKGLYLALGIPWFLITVSHSAFASANASANVSASVTTLDWSPLEFPQGVCEQLPAVLEISSLEREFELKDVASADFAGQLNGPLEHATREFVVLDNCEQVTSGQWQFKGTSYFDYEPTLDIRVHPLNPGSPLEAAVSANQLLSSQWQSSTVVEKRQLTEDYAETLNAIVLEDTHHFALYLPLCGAYKYLNEVANATQCFETLESSLKGADQDIAKSNLQIQFYFDIEDYGQAMALIGHLTAKHKDTFQARWPALDIRLHAYLGLSEMMTAYGQSNLPLFEQAKTRLEGLVETASQLSDHKLTASLLDMLTPYYVVKRLPDEAQLLYQHALLYHELSGSDFELRFTLNNYGLLQLRNGKILEAQQLFRQALALSELEDNTAITKTILHNLAQSYYELGEANLSSTYFEQSLNISRYISEQQRIKEAQRFFGRALADKEDFASAEALLLDSIAYFEGQQSAHLPLYKNEYAKLALKQGDTVRASAYLDLSHVTPDSTALEINQLEALLIAAEIALVREDTEQFNQYVSQIESFVTEEGKYLQLEMQLARLKLDFQTQKQNIQGIKAAADDTFRFIEQIQTKLDIHKTGPLWAAQVDQFVNRYIDVLYQHYRVSGDTATPAHIFNVIERFQAVNHRQAVKGIGANEAQDKETPESQHLKNWLPRLIQNEANSDNYAKPDNDALFVKNRVLQETSLATAVPTLLLDDNRRQLVELSVIQSKLADDEVLLRYKVTETAIYVFIIDAQNWRLEKLEGDFGNKRSGLLSVQPVYNPSGYLASMNDLSGIFPFQMLGEKAATKVIIFPDGFLHNLSFSALNIANNRQYKPAIEAFDISYAFSVNDYVLGTSTAVDYEYDISVFADPQFAAQDSQPQINDVEQREQSNWRNSAVPLPWSRKEAIAIKERFDKSKVQLFLGNKATRNALLSPETLDSKIIHIATHGYFSSNNPHVVGLLTASDDKSGLDFVSLADLGNRRFTSELIVVSGCDTNLGEFRASEGINSMTKNLLASGAKSVIGTLWKVPDRATSLFMNYFYQALESSGDSRAALASAQRQMRRTGRFRHPKYWAPFMLIVSHQQNNLIAL